MKRVLIIVLATIVIVAAVAVGLVEFSRNDTDAVSTKDLAKLVDIKTASTTKSIDPGLRPAAGTYTYAGKGLETINILGGSKHVFPETLNAIVQLDADNACGWTLDMVFVKQHLETRGYCTTKTGITDSGFSRTTDFLSHKQTSTYDCAVSSIRLKAGAKTGDSWSFTCTEDRGALVSFTTTNVGPETLTIDGAPVATQHVKVVGTQRESGTGDEATEYWLAPSGMIVRVTSKRSLDAKPQPVIGEMKLREQYSYELESMTPSK